MATYIRILLIYHSQINSYRGELSSVQQKEEEEEEVVVVVVVQAVKGMQVKVRG